MGMNFPNSPSVGQTYPQPPVAGQSIYQWDGLKWSAIPATGPQGPAGPAGPQGPTGPQGPKGDTGATPMCSRTLTATMAS